MLDGAQSGGDVPPINPEWTPVELEEATIKYQKQNLQTLIDNAVGQGYKPEDVEAKFVTDEEFAKILEASKTPEQKAAELNALVKAALNEIDLKSIRSIRERMAIQPDAPKFLILHEAAAIAERAKLTK